MNCEIRQYTWHVSITAWINVNFPRQMKWFRFSETNSTLNMSCIRRTVLFYVTEISKKINLWYTTVRHLDVVLLVHSFIGFLMPHIVDNSFFRNLVLKNKFLFGRLCKSDCFFIIVLSNKYSMTIREFSQWNDITLAWLKIKDSKLYISLKTK